ncbi:MAG: sugar transferase [Nitriliruptorales bacterium]
MSDTTRETALPERGESPPEGAGDAPDEGPDARYRQVEQAIRERRRVREPVDAAPPSGRATSDDASARGSDRRAAPPPTDVDTADVDTADDDTGRMRTPTGEIPAPERPIGDDRTGGLPLMTRLNEAGFRLVMLLDGLALLAVLVASMVWRYQGFDWPRGPLAFTQPYTLPQYFLAFVTLTVLHLVLFYFGGLYEREPRLGRPSVLPRVARLSAGAIIIFQAAGFVLSGTGARFLPIPTRNLVTLFVVGSLLVALNRELSIRNQIRLRGRPRVLLVGEPGEVNVARAHLRADGEHVELAGAASTTEDLLAEVEQLDVTDIVLLSSAWLESLYPTLVREFEARDIGLLQRVSARETLFGLARVRQVGGMPFVPLKEHTLPLSRVRFKRFLELGLLLATAPVWAPALGLLCLHQLAVVGPPIFFWQKRVGADGRIFEMVKFRTMRPEAEEDGNPRLATQDDPRIVPACRWLRASRLDEVPQLWNVLKGEMSLVGPRPERPELTAQFEELIPGYATRYEIPPGITGLAQVHGRYHTDPEYKLGYDLQYLVNWSPLLDLEILVRTVWVVLARRI